jgi:hypothetical protein
MVGLRQNLWTVDAHACEHRVEQTVLGALHHAPMDEVLRLRQIGSGIVRLCQHAAHN